jgi:hypothetical protein
LLRGLGFDPIAWGVFLTIRERNVNISRYKYKKVSILGAFSLLLPFSAYCGNSVGDVTEVLVLAAYANLVFVKVSGSNASLPACSIASNRYVLDTSTNTGKQIFAMVLAAKHAGAAITLVGAGTCTQVFNSEDLIGAIQT